VSFTEAEEQAIRTLLESGIDITEDQARAAVLRLREDALKVEREGLLAALPEMDPKIATRALEAMAQRHFELADDIGAEEERKNG